jgi:phage baseplate assembly protein W
MVNIYSDLSFTPSLNNEGDLTKVYDNDAINQSLYCIMNTRKGARIFDSDFGCDYQTYLFDPLDVETANNILKDILKAFAVYEPRIKIMTVDKNINYNTLQYTFTFKYVYIKKNEVGEFTVSLQKL